MAEDKGALSWTSIEVNTSSVADHAVNALRRGAGMFYGLLGAARRGIVRGYQAGRRLGSVRILGLRLRALLLIGAIFGPWVALTAHTAVAATAAKATAAKLAAAKAGAAKAGAAKAGAAKAGAAKAGAAKAGGHGAQLTARVIRGAASGVPRGSSAAIGGAGFLAGASAASRRAHRPLGSGPAGGPGGRAGRQGAPGGLSYRLFLRPTLRRRPGIGE
jgi:hypothetical protein